MSSRKQASCRSSRRNDRKAERSFFSFVVIGTTSHLVICQKHTTTRWHSSPSMELTFYTSTRRARRRAHPHGCTPKSREIVHVSRNLQNRAEKVLTESPTGPLETSAGINTCTKARTPPRAAQDAQTAKRPFCGEFAARNRQNDALEDVIRHDAAGLPARDPQDAAGRWHSRGELAGCSSRIYVLFTL